MTLNMNIFMNFTLDAVLHREKYVKKKILGAIGRWPPPFGYATASNRMELELRGVGALVLL